MITPFRLRKADKPGDVAGLLLVSDRAADLLDLIAAIGGSRPPAAFALPGGFLLKLPNPTARAFPNTIRLRGLAADLFLPADAELIPALLPDETAGLVRERGLVFLPGGRVYGYAVNRPLEPAALLEVERRPSRAWRPLPERPARPERLREILLDRPNETTETVLQAGGEGIGVEAPQPDAAGPLATAGGAVQFGAGKFLQWLGGLTRLKRLAAAGAEWVRSAVERAPQLNESVRDRQEAALRALLREFREGDLEKALRRALPFGEAGDRGGAEAKDANLPVHKLAYSLKDLLGGRPGRAGVWTGAARLQSELSAEYRKAAEAATARGDYRRAAFIYGKLLRSYQLAAAVLSRGGLHHDAAILYLEKLDDLLMAARAFAAAGEIDRAVELYRRKNEHAMAGDLLRQAGEDEAALAEYRVAADRLAAVRLDHAAGELMLKRAGRPDVAREYFAAGWARRPVLGSFSCLQSLARLHAEEESAAPVLALLDEADAYFARPGNEVYAAPFYNELARLADRPNRAAERDELRDRALRGLAAKLRQSAAAAKRGGSEPSLLLGQSGEWPAAVVSDAAFAFRQAAPGLKAPAAATAAAPPSVRRVYVARGQVTAVCGSPKTGRVCVGLASGLAVTFDPETGSNSPCTFGSKEPWPVASVAFDADGEQLLIVRSKDGKWAHLAMHQWRDNAFRHPAEVWWSTPVNGAAYVTPPVMTPDGQRAGFWDGSALAFLSGPDLIPVGRFEPTFPAETFNGALLLDSAGDAGAPLAVLFGQDAAWFVRPTPPGGVPDATPAAVRYVWRPCRADRSALHHPPLAWVRPMASLLHLADVDQAGAVCVWVLLGDRMARTFATRTFTAAEKYRAAAFVGPCRVAAVRPGGVDWLRYGEPRLTLAGTTPAQLRDAIACFYSAPTRELLVVTSTGDVVRVPAPNG